MSIAQGGTELSLDLLIRKQLRGAPALVRVKALAKLWREVEETLNREVEAARRQKATWELIARALGVCIPPDGLKRPCSAV
jgi:hypothetical protein